MCSSKSIALLTLVSAVVLRQEVSPFTSGGLESLVTICHEDTPSLRVFRTLFLLPPGGVAFEGPRTLPPNSYFSHHYSGPEIMTLHFLAVGVFFAYFVIVRLVEYCAIALSLTFATRR